MSRETLLDEAIIKAKEAEDWQLVEWLRLARGGESAARWYTQKLRELQDENDKLRELVSDMYTSMHISCQFDHSIPIGTMAHAKNRAIGLGIEVKE